MKSLSIIDIIEMNPDDHDLELDNKIEATPEYQEALTNFKKAINTLETSLKLKIDDEVARMEVAARDIAFNEGFKMAVRLILSIN